MNQLLCLPVAPLRTAEVGRPCQDRRTWQGPFFDPDRGRKNPVLIWLETVIRPAGAYTIARCPE